MKKSFTAMPNEADVRSRIESYEDSGVTDELYDFGKMLVAEALDRNSRLETKAAAIAAYAIGIITLLVSSYVSWGKAVHSLVIPVPIFGAFAAFVAAAYAVTGIKLRNYDWFSPDEWMKSECLSSREHLRRYHLLTMWNVLKSHYAASEIKAKKIRRAQGWLLFAAVILVVSLVDVIASALLRG
jgi:hypothetical protein